MRTHLAVLGLLHVDRQITDTVRTGMEQSQNTAVE